MENFIVTCKVMLPLIIYLFFGMLLKKWKIIDESFCAQVSVLLNRGLLPINLFNSLYKSDLSQFGKDPAAYYVMAGQLIAIGLMWMLAVRLTDDPGKQGSIIHCGTRGNTMLFALPVATAVFGEDQVSDIVLILAALVLIGNIVFVMIVQYFGNKAKVYRGEAPADDNSNSLGAMLISCAKNPLVKALALAFVWNIAGIPMPEVGETCISSLSGMVVPLAFILLGGRFDLDAIKRNSGTVSVVVFSKLVVLPLIFVILPIVWGWDQKMVLATVLSFGTPSAVSSYPMSAAFGCDGDLAGMIVTLTSCFAMITVFLWIFALKSFGILL